jgi:capsular polysaccharide biosynthesis protein
MSAALPVDAAAREAWQNGWDAASRDPLAPNPHHWKSPAFRPWMQGFFAFQSGQRTPVAPAEAPALAQAAEAAPAFRLRSPAFALGYPQIVNRMLITPPARAVLDPVWHSGLLPEAEVQLLRVENAIVVGDGLVFGQDLQVVAPTGDGFSKAELAQARADLQALREQGAVNQHSGTHLMLMQPSLGDYQTVLTSLLPAALLAQQLLSSARLTAMVYRSDASQLDMVYQGLRQAGIGLDQMLIAGPEPVQCEAVLLMTGLTRDRFTLSPLVLAALEAMALNVPGSGQTKLFVRNGAGLRNEDEVAAYLAETGYEAIDPSGMSFTAQIAAFQSAERVVGAAGPWMANIAFCQAGAKVAALTAADSADAMLWMMATIKRLSYIDWRCEGSEEAGFSVSEQDIALLQRF